MHTRKPPTPEQAECSRIARRTKYYANLDKNREESRERCKLKYAADPSVKVAYQKANAEERVLAGRKHGIRKKMSCIGYYSKGSCCCARCGISDMDLLCLDHVSNNGKAHRVVVGRASGTSTTGWIITNGFPPGFQVLCFNCNMKKELVRKRTERGEENVRY
jgi:hypothetical protein